MENTNARPNPAERKILTASVVIGLIIIASAWLRMTEYGGVTIMKDGSFRPNWQQLREEMFAPAGLALPIHWQDLGASLVAAGVIDMDKLMDLYGGRGGLSQEELLLLTDNVSTITMTSANSPFLLNLFWALGLANENQILDGGPMTDVRYQREGRALGGNFASTGGWVLADGDAMNHYSKHQFITLTTAQQEQVERISQNIFRPCCDNPAYFPDCNHGMAMLGLLQLLARENLSDDDIYEIALGVNAYWFPDAYLTIAAYLETEGKDWKEEDPKILLAADYSSASGFSRIRSRLSPPENSGGQSCGA